MRIMLAIVALVVASSAGAQDMVFTNRALIKCTSPDPATIPIVSTTSINFAWWGGSQDVVISDVAGCNWVVVPHADATWLIIDGMKSAKGSGIFTVRADGANPFRKKQERTAKITIIGTGGTTGKTVITVRQRK